MVLRRAVCSCLVFLACLAGPAAAQSPGGSIVGRVGDATGLALPGVVVTLQGVDITQAFKTDVDGRYRFLDLAPGPYRVTCALQGFTTNVRDHVIITVGRTVELPVTMTI